MPFRVELRTRQRDLKRQIDKVNKQNRVFEESLEQNGLHDQTTIAELKKLTELAPNVNEAAWKFRQVEKVILQARLASKTPNSKEAGAIRTKLRAIQREQSKLTKDMLKEVEP